MACHRSEFKWLKQKCTECGGTKDPKANASIQKMYGCVKPSEKPHILRVWDEDIVTHECPNKMMNSVSEYLRVYEAAESNRLQYLYPPGELPAKMIQAMDLIDSEKNKIMQEESDKLEQEARERKR